LNEKKAVRVEEVTDKVSTKGKPFKKIIADGLTYNAWEGSEAFKPLSEGIVKVGDHVNLLYTENKVGTTTYKNLDEIIFVKKDSSPVEKPIADNSSEGYWQKKFKFDIANQKGTRMSYCIEHAIKLIDINKEKIPGKDPVSQETIIGIANFFYEKISEKVNQKKQEESKNE